MKTLKKLAVVTAMGVLALLVIRNGLNAQVAPAYVPGLKLAIPPPSGTNLFLNLIEADPAGKYDVYSTPNLAWAPWNDILQGTNGQTNFTMPFSFADMVFFRAARTDAPATNTACFTACFPDPYVNTNLTSAMVSGGVAAAMAVLVNDTNLADAVWVPFSAVPYVLLGTTDGTYQVLFGFIGADGQTNWTSTTVTLARVLPTITQQPVNVTTNAGGSATFSVTVGTNIILPLSYQWYFNSGVLTNATNAVLTLTNVQPGQAGDYSLVITNVAGSLTSSNAVLTVISPPPCDPAPSGLISWWQAESNANDYISGNNGIAQGVTYAAGEVGQAFVFTGSDSSYIEIPASSSLDVGQGVGFTLEMWCNPTTTNFSGVGVMTLAEWNDNSGAFTGIGCHLEFYNGGVILGDIVNPTDGSDHFVQSADGNVTPNVWQHVAMTYDKTTGILTIYQNGVVVASGDVGVWRPSTSFDFYLGKRAAGVFAPIPYQGLMDEASLYNRALSAAEIQATYNAGSSGKCLPAPTFSGLTASQSTSYGTNAITLAGSVSAQGPIYPASGETVTVTINGNAQTTTISDSSGDFSITYNPSTIPVSASPCTITYSYGGDSRLSPATDASTTLTVNPAAVSITASAQSKTYGQTVAFGSGSTLFASSGLQNGETVGSVTLSCSGGAANAPVSGSPYTITLSAATGGTFTAANYNITYNTGLLTVNPAALSITAGAQSKTYGQTVAFGSGSTLFSSSGLQNGETIGTVTLACIGGAATAAVGSYTITPGAAVGGTFAPANYDITYISGELTVNPVPNFTILHTFTATSGSRFGPFVNTDGANPEAGLIISGNILYGTAMGGGSSGDGTVFAVNINGTGFTNLHSFAYSDGAEPEAGLVLSGNTLYGTTPFGGSPGVGTVFAVNTDGTGFTTLHSFDSSDGGNPVAGLILSGNTLYGTANQGGGSNVGTVFAVNTDGTGFTTLHSFDSSDGSNPNAGLILSGNTLYGTTSTGGSSGRGTVFAVNTNGTGFTTLYNFTLGSNGNDPAAGLILSGNALYGTAYGGSSGEGTVFAVNTNGTGFTTLYNFTLGSDGVEPQYAGLILSGNTLYGTTYKSGTFGNGTVYGLSLALPAPTFSGLTASQSIAYGTNAITLAGSVSAQGPIYPASGETVTVSINGNAQTTTISDSSGDFSITYNPSTIPVSASPCTITYSYGGDSNLSSATDTSTTLTVNPAALSITASAQSKNYGQTLAFGSGSTLFASSGLQNGETVGSVTLDCSGGAATAAVGSYTITPSAATGGTFNAANYSITYNTGELAVNPVAVIITTQPQSQTANVGSTVQLSVAADPSGGPYTYQWYFANNALADGNDISGSQSATLTLNNVQQSQAGAYYVVVSDSEGSTPSANGTLTLWAWSYTGSLNNYREGHTATLLQNGRVLVAGGWGAPGAFPSVELYNPSTGTWTVTNSMNTARWFHAATLLTNGQVLVVGGMDTDGNNLSSAELYNPATGTWTVTNSMLGGCQVPTATLLTNGLVLVTPICELYNPATGTWTAAGSSCSAGCTATLLTNGLVLVAGGNGPSDNCQLYNPANRAWTVTGSLNTERFLHTATLLTNGQVLVAGGYGYNSATGTWTDLASAELYDPATGKWTMTGSLSCTREEHVATLLTNGQVLVAGGIANGNNDSFSSAEVYNPATGKWAVTYSMNEGRVYTTMTLLTNGLVLVAGGDHFAISATAELYMPSSIPPVITTQPQSQTVCAGNTVTFNVAVNGSQLSYQWQKNGVNLSNVGNVSGATTATLTLTAVSSADAATYTVTASNGNGPATSLPAILTIPAQCTPPVITTQPPSYVYACPESTETITVALSGPGPMSCRWQKNGVNMSDGGDASGTATATLTLSPVANSDAAVYKLYVSNQAGGVLSAGSSLEVLGPPQITTQPQTQTANVGDTVQFSAAASSDGPFSYQWYFGYTYDERNALTNGNGISGSQSATLTLNNVQQSQAGPYYVVVSGCGGSTTSTNATLTVGSQSWAWSYTRSMNTGRSMHTASLLTNGWVLAAGGRDGSLNIVSSAELYNPVTMTWSVTGSMKTARENHTATLLQNGQVLVAGGDNESGCLSSAELYNPATGTWTVTGSMNYNREYHTATLLPDGQVLVAGGTDCNWSSGVPVLNTAELYNPATGIWTATGLMHNAHETHTATLLQNGQGVLVAGGDDGYGYVLAGELYNLTSGTWTATGSLNQGREFATATLLQNGQVLVAGGGDASGGLSSSELYIPSSGTWTVKGPMNDMREMHVATLLQNGQVLVAGGDDGSDNISYSSAETYNPASGAWTLTSSMNEGHSYATMTLLANGQALVAGGQGNTITASAELYMPLLSTPVIATQPQSQTVCAGQITFNVKAIGTLLSYQWQKNGVNLYDNFINVYGANTPMLCLIGVSSADAASYTVTVSSSGGSVSSAAATLSVPATCTPVIVTQPQSQTAAPGAMVTFTVTATGPGPLVYQWQENGAVLCNGAHVSGSTTTNLTMEGVSAANAGTYTVTVSNGAGSATSAGATLIISGSCNTTITSQPISQSVATGATVSFSVAAGSGSLTYQWLKNGANLAGANSPTLTLSNVSSTDAGLYTVNVCGSCCVLSQPANLEVSGFNVRISEPKNNAILP
jgi:uncharacterized repeat protein (TIGR03803 family)